MRNPGSKRRICTHSLRAEYGRGISMSCVILLPAVFLSVCGPVFGYQGGTGEPCDPYQIANARDLLRIGSDIDLMSKSYVLVGDIDLDPNAAGGRIFDTAVITCRAEKGFVESGDSRYRSVGGSEVAVFEGAFFGNGHVIRNMVIEAGEGKCVGLFAYPGEAAVVSDLRIENARVKGSMHVGLLAGINAGTVSYCRVSGSVEAKSRGGGMIGTNLGELTCCGAETSVVGERMLGGLVGHSMSESSLTHCRAKSRVVGERNVGGLVGEMLPGTLTGCFAAGSVVSEADGGGLVGAGPFGGTVLKCYSTVDVKGVTIGGLIGIAQRTRVTNSHAFGALARVASSDRGESGALGGIVGQWRGGSGSIISSSWHTDMAPADVAIGRSAPNSKVNLLSTHGHAPHAKGSEIHHRHSSAASDKGQSAKLSVKRCADTNVRDN